MTLNEIMKNMPTKRRGRILLQSNQSKKRLGRTFFIPYVYYPKLDCWMGIKRWYGNNNKSPLRNIGASSKYFLYCESKISALFAFSKLWRYAQGLMKIFSSLIV